MKSTDWNVFGSSWAGYLGRFLFVQGQARPKGMKRGNLEKGKYVTSLDFSEIQCELQTFPLLAQQSSECFANVSMFSARAGVTSFIILLILISKFSNLKIYIPLFILVSVVRNWIVDEKFISSWYWSFTKAFLCVWPVIS